MRKSMNLVCFGAGEKSKYVKNLIQQNSSHHVLYYVENQLFHKIGTEYDGLEVVSIYKLKHLYESGAWGGGSNYYCIS